MEMAEKKPGNREVWEKAQFFGFEKDVINLWRYRGNEENEG